MGLGLDRMMTYSTSKNCVLRSLQDVRDLVQDSLVLAGISPFLWFDSTNLIIIFGSPRYNDFKAFKHF